MFEALTETWSIFFNWAKENGDVLGTIGFLFAMFTVVITNGRLILMRLRGQQGPAIAPGAITIAPPSTNTETGLVTVDAPPPSPEYGNKTPIAVLPPKEMGAYDDHFADGLMDDLIADLQKAAFATPDPTTVSSLLNAGASSAKIARDLGVRHVLTTSIRRQDDRIRVTAQLVDPTGAILWSDRFTATGNDLMAMQESFAEKIAGHVRTTLGDATMLKNPETGAVYKTREEALRSIASPKSRLTALLLCLSPLGFFGTHRFYLGRPFTGTLYIATVGLFLCGWLIDTILITFGMFTDGKDRPVRIWHHDPLKRMQ